jgi:GNAT-family acetyltransferase (TIGR03103 family)
MASDARSVRRARRGQTRPRRPGNGHQRDAVLDCGWGRLLFGQTFEDPGTLVEAMRAEAPGRRDICIYLPDAHVVASQHPDALFIDPSFTLRLRLTGAGSAAAADSLPPAGFTIRLLRDAGDAHEVNRIYAACSMVAADPDTTWANQRTRVVTHLVAEDDASGRVIGTVTGVDHRLAFNDPDDGSSLWCLAVDPTTTLPGVGEALVRALAGHFTARGRSHLDLTVMHDNEPALALYDKLGFRRVPDLLVVKHKNPINEPLFVPGPRDALDQLNPYARIVADEARRRGIAVEVLDTEAGYLRLTHGGRDIITRESLSELTTAVAMSRCDDKRITRKVLAAAGLSVAAGQLASTPDEDRRFLATVGSVVVKPVRGEQGRGITVGVNDPERLSEAIAEAHRHCPEVLLEQYRSGRDLRVVVIDHEVVAAAERRPATVVGNGRHTVAELIDAQSRRRRAATGGEATIPLDTDTLATVSDAGHGLDDVLAPGDELAVRRTANLHTGGTLHDVTAVLHPTLAQTAVAASLALAIPVTGVDFIVAAPDDPDHVIIEANERPGLANHEPHPTAQRFIDLLFPATRAMVWPGEAAGQIRGGERFS